MRLILRDGARQLVRSDMVTGLTVDADLICGMTVDGAFSTLATSYIAHL